MIYNILYLILGTGIIIIDILSKQWALSSCTSSYSINQLLTCELTMNPGISWGMLQTNNSYFFMGMSLIIAGVIAILAYHAAKKWALGLPIFGEVMVLAGAYANLLDRIIYSGVIDFIIVGYKGWFWPTFNIADCAIVIGVGIMFYSNARH